MKRKWIWKLFGILCAWLIFMWASWSGAFFAAHWLSRIAGWQLTGYWLQIVGNTIALLFMLSVIFTIGAINQPKRRQGLLIILDALRRISNGDFNVEIENKQPDQAFGELITSINDMAAGLNRLEAMRQEFISNVSHEIQSPLTSIGGFARALREQDLPAVTRDHYLTIIETECKRLSRLSDHLLKLSSLDSEQHPFEPVRFRLDKQLGRIILSSEPLWSAKDIEVSAELEELSVTADEELISQIWINLLQNSIKFTPPGGVITVRLERCGDRVAVEIADTGVGIEETDLEHIFERFYKADKARERSSGGNGLGLAIVKKIVDMHHAEITVTSTPGQGTTFRVLLPDLPDAK
ncbi:ATP-binding protein [Paenibacillus allorhizosphaerae]|uniref:histidine kinase n=1 Tax=Paenibacillus allorhizosphaerae TaxID=2849866 RepID=A0ABM8VI67_9BACL|nr:HAMP domain-containing sensor histidine kinase [Paenibacillus allorhizosphaerae]CAG7643435.1 Adaptive-response sensory-kinase SasA [Paenibacillus allorhizosphaerae]